MTCTIPTQAQESVRPFTMRTVCLMAVLYVVRLAICYIAGVRFDSSILTHGWQVLDPELLRSHLLESLYYLHSQPPGFNLFIGCVIKLFPHDYLQALSWIYCAGGLVLYLEVYFLMRKCHVGGRLSFWLSTIFMVSPAFILYESFLFYTLPIAILLTGSALALIYFLETSKAGWCAVLNVCLFSICMINAMFHLIFYLLVVIWLVRILPTQRRQVIACSWIPLVLIFALYSKNFLLVGQFTSSTWLGQNIAINRLSALPDSDRQRLINAGTLSPVSMIPPFSMPEMYPAKYFVNRTSSTFPGWASAYKSNGDGNYNHFGFVGISKDYLRDTLYVMRYRPRLALVSTAKAVYYYLCPSSDYLWGNDNDIKIKPLIALTDHAVFGKIVLVRGQPGLYGKLVMEDGKPGRREVAVYPILIAGIILTLVYSSKLLFSQRGRPSWLTSNQLITARYMFVVIVYVMLVGFLNATENNRMRFDTDPFYALLFSICCCSIVPQLREQDRSAIRKTPAMSTPE